MKIFGFGMDNKDGHKRITQGAAFELFSGSEASHEEMQALCVLLDEEFKARGSSLEEATKEDVIALVAMLAEKEKDDD